MNKLFILARIFLFFLSCFGYIQYLRKSVRTEFCIGLLFSGIVSVLFLAGILNLLRVTTWVLFGIGLILAIFSIKQKMRVSDILCPGMAFFLLTAALLPFLLYGAKFEGYDNFSHWAIAARVLFEEHRFPNFQDQYIFFSSYPLGSACFLYYFVEIAGACPEWLQMYAQAILIAGLAVSLFAFARGRIASLIAAVLCVCLLCSNTSLFDLMVDNLLALSAFGAAAFCIYYGRDLKDRLWYFLPYAIFLITVKNSGVLFTVVLCGYIWFTLRHENIPLKNWLLLFLIPIAVLILWQRHVSLVFPNGLLAPHSMSLSFYKRHVNNHQRSDALRITESLIRVIFSPSNHALWVLLSGLVFRLVMRRVSGKPHRELGATLLLAAVTYLLYQIGMVVMYLFSMPTSEALSLAGYDRYHPTIVTFLVGLLLIEVFRVFPLPRNPEKSSVRSLQALSASLAAIIVCVLALSPHFSDLQRQNLEGTMRAKYDKLIADYDIPENAELILVTQDESGYLIFLTHYLLRPQMLIMATDDTISLDSLSYIDYIIMFDESEKTKAFLSELSPGYSEPVYHLF